VGTPPILPEEIVILAISLLEPVGRKWMLNIAFTHPDERMPRTVFYQKLQETLLSYPGISEDHQQADILFPIEDTAMETNWPRYGRPESSIIRGVHSRDTHIAYLEQLGNTGKSVCLVNMIPYLRVPQMMAAHDQVIVADINLVTWERALNPRTISMPALPATVGHFDPRSKCIMASFRGADSHPCRKALTSINDGRDIVVEIVPPDNHTGRIDAVAGVADLAYCQLLNASIFAFVPRGDSEFSYRLLEVMSFGCIPVVLADGWVLPFDRTIHWAGMCLQVPEHMVHFLPDILAAIPPARVEAMQSAVVQTYRQHFADFPSIVGTLLAETSQILATPTTMCQNSGNPTRDAVLTYTREHTSQ
jgi:hypothetical protein